MVNLSKMKFLKQYIVQNKKTKRTYLIRKVLNNSVIFIEFKMGNNWFIFKEDLNNYEYYDKQLIIF